MGENFSVALVAAFFLLLIGSWVLLNALIDLGARRLRQFAEDGRASLSRRAGR
jgi:hypothetical protein